MSDNPLRRRTAEPTQGSLYIERIGPTYTHDLARAYNRRLAEREGKQFEAMEWIVTDAGELKLVYRLEFQRRNLERGKQRVERDRKRWADTHMIEHRPFAPPERPEVDIFQPSGAEA